MTTIFALTNKATPVGTDEIELQETADGGSFKTTLSDAVLDVLSAANYDFLTPGTATIASTDVVLSNAEYLKGKDTGGVARVLVGMDGSDIVQIGQSASNVKLSTAETVRVVGPPSSFVFDVRASKAAKFYGISVNESTPFTGLFDSENVFFEVREFIGGYGGAVISGVNDTVSTDAALCLRGLHGTTNPTDGVSAVQIRGGKSDGATSGANQGATETVFDVAGWDGTTSYFSIIGSGRVTLKVQPATLDEPFINFVATADADATSALSSLTTSGAVTHHIQVKINGVKAWIPCSTTDPS